LAAQEIAVQAARLGADTLRLWTLLENKAALEVAGRRGKPA
jgi:hypothetical protein